MTTTTETNETQTPKHEGWTEQGDSETTAVTPMPPGWVNVYRNPDGTLVHIVA